MLLVTTVAEMHAWRRAAPGSVGLVPTMGYLHEGHLSLVRQARRDNDHVVVSIFVNPTQFGPQEDFRRYPRDPDHDLALLAAEGTDVVFIPTVEDVYPPGYNTYVEVGGVSERLEGAARPGHFRGVATVVAKLFNAVQPQRAYFGRKDAQQLRVIQKMARDLDMDIQIVPMPTLREPDGLAMSSRNSYLSPADRQAARVLQHSLQLAQRLYQDGERDAEAIRAAMRRHIEAEPLATIDYISVADADTLAELARIEGPTLVSLAVRIGQTRLIDNIELAGAAGVGP